MPLNGRLSLPYLPPFVSRQCMVSSSAFALLGAVFPVSSGTLWAVFPAASRHFYLFSRILIKTMNATSFALQNRAERPEVTAPKTMLYSFIFQ